MAEVGRVSIRLPSSIKQGDVIRVRSLIIHPNELVQRDKQGSIVRRNYNFVHTLLVAYNGKEVMAPRRRRRSAKVRCLRFRLKSIGPAN